MPAVAQFTLPQPGQTVMPQQAPASPKGMPPVAQFQLPQSAEQGNQSSIPAPAQPFSDAGSDIASGNGANGGQRAIGAAKGIVGLLGSLGGTTGDNPVINGMLANAPAFNKDIQAANSFSKPTNFPQEQGASESQMGAGLLGGTGATDIASDAVANGIPAVKGAASAVQGFVKANPVKSAIGAYVIANLLKNTGLGSAIESATGIKGLLDLIP